VIDTCIAEDIVLRLVEIHISSSIVNISDKDNSGTLQSYRINRIKESQKHNYLWNDYVYLGF